MSDIIVVFIILYPNNRISQAKIAHMCNVSTGLIGSLETGKVQGPYFGISHKFRVLALISFLKIDNFSF